MRRVNSSDVNLVLFGTVSDGSGDPASLWRGTFTTQFDVQYQELLDTVFNQGGKVANTYSATFTGILVTPRRRIAWLGRNDAKALQTTRIESANTALQPAGISLSHPKRTKTHRTKVR